MNEITGAVIALIILAAVSDVVIFRREHTAKLVRAVWGQIPKWLVELIVALLSGLVLLGLFLILRQLMYSAAAFAHYVWAAPAELPHYPLQPKDLISLESNRIQIITTAVQAVGGLAVLAGIVLAWANLKTTQKAQQDTLRLTNEGQITERFSRAIDQLGSGQLEIRLGAIYALERIARDSAKDHWPIMEVLTAYVRVHAPIAEADKNAPTAPPEPDIQAILTVIGRRDTRVEAGNQMILNLAQTKLTRANLGKANLRGASLSGADLSGADLSGAFLSGASLLLSDLSDTFMGNANLSNADLSIADLTRARLESADLSGALLFGPDLTGADLRSASFSGSDLRGAKLTGANLRGADLTGANLQEAENVSQEQIDSAKGDEDTKLPPSLVMPDSWKK